MNGHLGPVLVVDDEEAMGLLLTHTLEKEGYTATVVKSGDEALGFLSRQSLDVMVLDLEAPGLSELEVLERIHKEHPDVAVIVTSALADVHGAVEAMKKGALDYVGKPFDRRDLLRRIREAREKRDVQVFERQQLRKTEDQLRKLQEALRKQFQDLVQSLAREHGLRYSRQGQGNQKDQGPEAIKGLPPEMRGPMNSEQEYASALLRTIDGGRTLARMDSIDLALVEHVTPPGEPITVEVVESGGVCPLGFAVGSTWLVDSQGRLSQPLCHPAAAAVASLVQRPKGKANGLKAECVCPLGRRLAFAIAQERGHSWPSVSRLMPSKVTNSSG